MESDVGRESEKALDRSALDALPKVVALCSSAGGLTALEEFFSTLPATTDACFVVIQHLSPDYRSCLYQLLQRHTPLEVCSIVNGMPVVAGKVFVLPPNKQTILCQGRLLLTDRCSDRSVIYPVDDFLRSLANEVGSSAIAVIFSGTGSDGSRGVRDLHAAGGFVIVQTPESASFSGMPKNAIATGQVDLVLSPREAAKAVIRKLERDHRQLQEREEEVCHSAFASEFDAPVRALRSQLGFEIYDFLPDLIFQAIARRADVLGLPSPKAYSDVLLQSQAECQQLQSDIVRGSTSQFFCDDPTYERLATDVVPTLMAVGHNGQDFRTWVIGAGTGEEVYTLAMLLAEWHEQKGIAHRVKIFASDVHADSLAIASRAVYTRESLQTLDAARIEKYFIERADGFHVVPELRKMVVFTPHNCLHEAPFTRMDMVCCRQLLGRLSMAAQAKVLSLIHFALRDGGALLVGHDFHLRTMQREFQPVAADLGIYMKHRLLGEYRGGAVGRAYREATAPRQTIDVRTSQRDLMELYDQMLEAHIPAAWLVAEDGGLLHTFQDAGKYLQTKGRSKSDLISLARDDLRGPLMLLMRQVTEARVATEIPHVSLIDNQGEMFTLRGEPLCTRGGRHGILIKLLRTAPAIAPYTDSQRQDAQSSTHGSRTELERELELTRENLQLTIQDLRLANEELKETNEELTCANEELQSANEELHSVNEELHTVNAEHQRKIDELTALNDDLDNLLTSSNVHTLFLSRDLRLRLFTPRIVELFSLIPQDIGRHISTFNHNLIDVSLAAEAKRVLEEIQGVRREVQSCDGNWFVLRISPYLSRGNVEGVVITLVDITSQKNAQNALLRSEQRFELAVQGSSEGIWDWPNMQEEKIWCSPRLYSILGYTDENFELTHSIWLELIHPEDRHAFEQLLESGGPFNFECRIERSDRSYRWVRICGASHRDLQGQPIRMAGSLEDVTERRLAQEEVKRAVQLRDRFLAMLSHELRNPLAAVLSAIQLHDEDHAQRDRALQVIRRQSRQMARLLDDLLDVSRITNDKFELIRQALDLREIIASAWQALQPLAKSRGLQLDYQTSADPIQLVGDPQRLEQVLANLINNAIKYSAPGGTIQLSTQLHSGHVAVSVKDSGVGLAPEMKERVFDLFVQSEATLDRSNGGMGVGLTLVKAIVEMHGGQVSVHSEGLNCGCEFIVQLPLQAERIEATVKPPRAIELPLRVVIVEDMEDSREMLAELLTLKGHQVAVAAEGIEGLALIQRSLPDVAIIDIGLPNLDGFEVARRLRQDPRHNAIKLVALTGYGQSADRQAVRAAGFDEHIVKPLKTGELMSVLGSHHFASTPVSFVDSPSIAKGTPHVDTLTQAEPANRLS